MASTSRARSFSSQIFQIVLLANAILLCMAKPSLPGVKELPTSIVKDLFADSNEDADTVEESLLKIFSGQQVEPGAFSFLVSINDVCGGAIIGPSHILTAAECVQNPKGLSVHELRVILDSMKVVVGDYDRDVRDGETRVAVSSIIVHPGYEKLDNSSSIHNIAIIKTETPMPFNSTGTSGGGALGLVSSIKMACGPMQDGEALSVVGWGGPGYQGASLIANSLPRRLQVVKLANDRCRCLMASFHIRMDDNQICAQPEPRGAVCEGDRGNPLFRNTTEGFELVGLVSSFKQPCVDSRVPAVYTPVGAYIDWILANQA